MVSGQRTCTYQVAYEPSRVVRCAVANGSDHQLRGAWRLVDIVNTREVHEVTASRSRVEPFRIALLADTQGCVHEYLHESVGTDQLSCLLASGRIRADERAESDFATVDDASCQHRDASNLEIPVALCEAQALFIGCPHAVPVKQGYVNADSHQPFLQRQGRGRLAGTAEASEPDAHTRWSIAQDDSLMSGGLYPSSAGRATSPTWTVLSFQACRPDNLAA